MIVQLVASRCFCRAGSEGWWETRRGRHRVSRGGWQQESLRQRCVGKRGVSRRGARRGGPGGGRGRTWVGVASMMRVPDEGGELTGSRSTQIRLQINPARGPPKSGRRLRRGGTNYGGPRRHDPRTHADSGQVELVPLLSDPSSRRVCARAVRCPSGYYMRTRAQRRYRDKHTPCDPPCNGA